MEKSCHSHINSEINIFLGKYEALNINEFKNYFLVNKKWNSIFNSKEMLNKLSENNRLYKQYKV